MHLVIPIEVFERNDMDVFLFSKIVWVASRQELFSRCGYSLRAKRTSGRIPMEARFSAHIQTSPGAHSAFCKWVLGSFPGVKAAGAWR